MNGVNEYQCDNMSNLKTDISTIMFGRTESREPEANEQWQSTDFSTVCVPAPQIRFRHTLLLLLKLAQVLNHVISGPQVSFVVMVWCIFMCMPSAVLYFANMRPLWGKQHSQKWKMYWRPFIVTKLRRLITGDPVNATAYCVLGAPCLFVVNFSFCYSYVWYVKETRRHDDVDIEDKWRTGETKECNSQPRNHHTTTNTTMTSVLIMVTMW